MAEIDPRALDRLLAVHLFGWQERPHPQGGTYWLNGDGDARAWTAEVPKWSTTWDGMGMVIEAMRAKGWGAFTLIYNEEDQPGDGWICGFGWDKKYPGYHPDSASMAVALAALAAVAPGELARLREGSTRNV